jgi:hypothetical protein
MRFTVVLLCLLAAVSAHAARKTLEEARPEVAAATGVEPRVMVATQMSTVVPPPAWNAKQCLLVIDDEAVRCLSVRNYEPRFTAKHSEISTVSIESGLINRIMVLAASGPRYFVVHKSRMAEVFDAIRERIER